MWIIAGLLFVIAWNSGGPREVRVVTQEELDARERKRVKAGFWEWLGGIGGAFAIILALGWLVT